MGSKTGRQNRGSRTGQPSKERRVSESGMCKQQCACEHLTMRRGQQRTPGGLGTERGSDGVATEDREYKEGAVPNEGEVGRNKKRSQLGSKYALWEYMTSYHIIHGSSICNSSFEGRFLFVGYLKRFWYWKCDCEAVFPGPIGAFWTVLSRHCCE